MYFIVFIIDTRFWNMRFVDGLNVEDEERELVIFVLIVGGGVIY